MVARISATTDHVCRDCGLTVAETTFHRNRQNTSGFHIRCVRCDALKRAERAQRTVDAARDKQAAREVARATGAVSLLRPRVPLKARLAARRRVAGGGTVESEIDDMIRRFVREGAKR